MPSSALTKVADRLKLGELMASPLMQLVRENIVTQRKYYGFAISAMVVIALTSALTAYMMEAIVDAMTSYESKLAILMVAFAVAGVFLIKGLATFIQLVCLSRAGNRIVATLQKRMYGKLLKHGVGFYTQNQSSDLLMRITNGAQGARMVTQLVITTAVRDTLMLVGLLAVMFYQQPGLSLITLVIGPLALLGLRKLLTRVKAIMKNQAMSLAEIIKVVQETSRGIQVIKVFSLEDQMTGRMGDAVRQVEKRANSIARLQAATSPMMETLAGFAIAVVVALSAYNTFGAGQMSAGQLMSFITALMMAYEPAKRLSRVRVQIEAQMVMVRMLFEMLEYTEDLVEHPDAKPFAPGDGTVELKDVSFRYRDETRLFDGLSLKFKPGQMTALVGPSGGGKSTILNLIMRLYDPTNGAVLIDGQDLRDVTFESLRQRISFVGQDTFLFSTTVMENIRYSRPGASDIEVFEAAKAANAHQFITELPEGYDTQVGEDGSFLSGGQRQRLAIARAVLRKSEILLLDEATSALDATSEALIREALDRLTEGVTTIVIAHRLSTVLGADQIYVLADGRVQECGTSDELLRQDGMFKTLFDQQFGGFKQAMDM
ncbi:MAG: ABC transporter ATP-binding protein [Pseudomonadota bacterium]